MTVSVIVIVACVARLLCKFSAFLIADAGMGAPARSHASSKGVRSRLLSSWLSQFACIQVIKSGRKFPLDARQRQAISVILQFSSWELLMQSWTHDGRDETNCAKAVGKRSNKRAASAKWIDLILSFVDDAFTEAAQLRIGVCVKLFERRSSQ